MARYFTQNTMDRCDGGDATVGHHRLRARAAGDVVFVELPEAGRQLAKGKDAAVVESVKAASDVYSPVSGTVSEAKCRAGGRPIARELGP
jgi:glycine cleavage system H protein